MLRRLQRLREHIRYHSAPRRSSAWSRALDIAFIVTFVLSFPAALLADLSQRDDRTAITLNGILARTQGGRIDAWLMTGQNTRAAPPANAAGAAAGSQTGGQGRARSIAAKDETIIGNFDLTVHDELRGWPLVTTIVRRPATLNFDVIAEPKPRTNVVRDVNDEFQREIEEALRLEDQFEAIAAWNQDSSHKRYQWWAWFPAFGAWWIMLFAVAGITIQFLRFGSLWLRSKQLQREYRRRADNKCIKCGYDMTGLEFNDKCPECGAFVM